MNFDVSRRNQTKQSKNDVFEALETQFRKISSQTNKSGDILVVKVINPTFGSINRADITTVSIEQKEDGFFINAEVKYKTSDMFWVFLIILLFSTVGWLIPIVFFFYQKNTVKTAIEEVFNRINDEFYGHSVSKPDNTNSTIDHFAELEKLANLRDKGILNQEEFEERKKKIMTNI